MLRCKGFIYEIYIHIIQWIVVLHFMADKIA